MATEAPVLVQVNFDGPSNKLDMRRASSDGRAQLKNDSSSGGKSPGKSRKLTSLFRRSSKEDLLSSGSGRFERSSGRGKRKTSKGSSSRDSSLDGLSSDSEPRIQITNSTELDDRTSGGVVTSSKPPLGHSRGRDYVISDSQELEQRSTLELSGKKVQKLIKQNNQLVKDVEALKKEKETLMSEKQKLKSDNKTLERELRRVSSKGEVQRLLKNAPAEADHDVTAEQRYQDRGKRIIDLTRKIRSTLERLERNESDQSDDLTPPTKRRLSTKEQNNGGTWEPGVDRTGDAHGINSSLQKENMELRSKVASLEAELGQLVSKTSPKTSRIKTGFFRRSKRQYNEVQREKQPQAPNDGLRSRSPEISLSDLLTFDTPSTSVEGTPVHKSIPAYISPNQSPKFDARDARNSEIQALQSRLKSVTDDKKAIEERNKALEAEIVEVRNQFDQLQGGGKKTSDEAERLRKSLKMANSEKTSLSGQIEHLRKEVDELQAGKRSAERTMMDSLKKKESKIQELEAECGRLSKDCDRLKKELELARGSATELKFKDRKIEELTLERSEARVESEKLRKELDSLKTSAAEMKKKDGRIEELELECRRAKKECERLQKELDSAKVPTVTESRSSRQKELDSAKVPTATESRSSRQESAKVSAAAESRSSRSREMSSTSSVTAAKPPSGARLTSPSHASTSSGRSIQTSMRTSSSTSVSKAPPPSPTSSTAEDSVFEADTSASKTKSGSTDQTAQSRATRKKSDEIGERRSSSGQSRSSKESSGPPKLRKRRSSTELIELFEQSKEALQKPAESNIKKNPSYANLSTSPLHRAKVAATRAMFEEKNGEESSPPAVVTRSGRADRSAYRRSWTGDLTQLRRSSDQTPTAAAIPEGKESTSSHTKSQSLDVTALFKEKPASSTPTSATVSTVTSNIAGSPKRTATTLSVSKPTSLNIGSSNSSTSSAKVNNTGTQHSVSSPSSSSSSPSGRTPNATSANVSLTQTTTPTGAKTSKITIKSSSTSTTPSASSPPSSLKMNGTQRAVNEATVGSAMKAEKVNVPAMPTPTGSVTPITLNQRSRVTSSGSQVKSPTTPAARSPVRSPTTPLKSASMSVDSNSKTTNSVKVTSNGVAKTPSYVPSYLRSNTVTGTETAANKGGTKVVANVGKPTITRSSTAVTFTVTSVGSRSNPVKTAVTPQPQPHQGVLKRGSTLDVPGTSDIKKSSSLENIPENVSENQSASKSNTNTVVERRNPPPPSTPAESTKTTVVMHRSPVQARFQRRKREERPKTMYAGANRSETVSLVRLISKYQEQERREKEGGKQADTSTKTTAPASTQVSAVNGNASPIPAAATTFTSTSPTPSATPSSSSTAVNSSARRRPQSYYGGSVDLVGSGFSTPAAVPAPSNMSSGRKPKKARRSQTVALGGINRQSKKAQLLRWCQIATDHYDNVSIDNFGESFADGLAFCALLHHFIPDQIPYDQLNEINREQNFTIAFEEAEKVGIPRLLDVEDMVALPIPDWMSVMTYITFVYNKFGKTGSPHML